MRLRFVSKDPGKISEATEILHLAGITIVPVALPIEELQSEKLEHLVRDKALKAFSRIGHRLFVEHTGLFLAPLDGFPGGLTQPFWNRVGAERMCQLFGGANVIARTLIGYCDGRRIHRFPGELKGTVALTPEGHQDFQWDNIFIPEGETKTLADLGNRKNDISMRRRALDKFVDYLKANPHGR